MNLARRVLHIPRVYRKLGSINGKQATNVLRMMMKLSYEPHPWDDRWRETAVDHQIRDEYWTSAACSRND